MSQYATAAQLQATPGLGAYVDGLSNTELDTALVRASGMMDDYLGARFVLPLTSWGESVRQCCCHLAAWLLASGRGFDSGALGNAAKQWFDWWMAWLKDVASGKVTPAGTDGTTASTAGPRVSSGEPRGW